MAELVIGGLALVVGVGSAIYSADRQRYAFNTQQDAILAGQAFSRDINWEKEQLRLIGVEAANAKNDFEQMKYGLLLQQYGMMQEMYGITAGLIGQTYALKNEVYEWQIATLDWEKDFRAAQAEMIKEKGAMARGLYGTETAKLLAHQRMMSAAGGVEIGVGSPVEVLGALASERQYTSDIMDYNTGVDLFEKKMQIADTSIQKDKVGFDRALADLGYRGDLADLGLKSGINNLNIQEATGLLALSKSDRARIGSMNQIELNIYTTSQRYGYQTATSQAGYYGNAAAYASGPGMAFNVGSNVFNSFNTYYTAKKVFGKPEV